MANSNITRNALAASLKELAQEKSIVKITVGEISERCGVNRQTFYYHFKDKGELISWYFNKQLITPLTTDLSTDNWINRLIEMFHLMYKDKEFICSIVKDCEQYFSDNLLKILDNIITKSSSENELKIVGDECEKKVLSRFLAHGITGIVIDWIKAGMPLDEDDGKTVITNIIRNMDTIKAILENHVED